MRATRCGQCAQFLYDSACPLRLDAPASRKPPDRASHFDIEEMRNDPGVIAPGQLMTDHACLRPAREKFDNQRCVEDDHRESRSSRIACTELFDRGRGFSC